MEDIISPEGSTHAATPERSPLKTGSSIVSKLSQLHFIPRLIGYSRTSYLIGIVLAFVIVSPIDWIPTPLLKIALYTIVLAITAILFALGGGVRELWRAPGRWWAWAATLAIPGAYFLSWYVSSDRSIAFIGVGNEVDTVFFVGVAALTLILAFGLFRTMRSIRQLVGAIGLVVIIAAVFQYISILAGSYVLPSVFADKSVNLIGKWNDFGMLISIGVLFLLVRLELGEDEGWRRYVAIAGLVFLTILIILVQFNFIWWFTIAGAALISLLKWLPAVHSSHTHELPVRPSRIPWFAGVAIIVCAIFLIAGTSIAAHLPGFLSIPSLEVRPAISTTSDIASAAHQGSFVRTILGTGPNTFTANWIQHKPISVNQTAFWSIDFLTGFSVFFTALVSVGLIGILAWLVPVVLVLMSLWKLRHIRRMAAHERLTLLSLGLASTFLWAGVLFYAGSQDMLLLAFATVGALWATEAAAQHAVSLPAVSGRRGRALIGALAAFVLVIVTVLPAIASSSQFLSYTYQQKGAKALQGGDIAGAAALADASQHIVVTSDNLRLGISIDYAQMQKLATSSTTPATIDAMRQQFQAALQAAIVQGQKASSLHPNDYQTLAALGQVYEYLVPLKVQGAFESAGAAYKKAMEINPTNPTLPLLLARLDATEDLKNNLTDVENLVKKSLDLKSNYTDAFLFAEQLAVAENDLPTATKAAEAAVSSSPQNPALWFQLGLFFYAGQDWTDALKSFQNAVSLQGDYANAKYFLGLSAFKTGDKDTAIKEFSDLSVTNPDNAEVKLVLSNLQAGKDPFANQTPPQPPPEKRTTAPVKDPASATN